MNLKLHFKDEFFSALVCGTYKDYHSTCNYPKLPKMQAQNKDEVSLLVVKNEQGVPFNKN